MHPFSLCFIIVSREKAAHQVPPRAFNPLLPGLLLSGPVSQSWEGSMAAPGKMVWYQELVAGFTTLGTRSTPRHISPEPCYLPQPLLQRVDAGIVISQCGEKVLRALGAADSLLALSSPF